MPNQRNQQSSGSGSGIKTAVSFGFGALVGALAAGAAYYFSSEEERHSQPHQVYQSNHPAMQVGPRTNNSDEKDDEKDEKDGTVKVCEICFVSFVELKECGIQIVSTPCGHVYCRDCIVESLTTKPECPHCRNVVHEHDLRRLYL